MGLITTYDDSNKVTDRGLAIRYSSEIVQETGRPTYYKLTRYCTKSYAYVGMDYQTAKDCASAKRAQYTRDYARLSSGISLSGESQLPTVTYIKECPVDIAPERNYGSMWSVVIQVNETDIKFAETNPVSIESFFAQENGRNYDEGNDGEQVLILNSANRSDNILTVQYSQQIGNFNPKVLILEYKTSESGNVLNALPNQDGEYNVPAKKLWINLSYGNVKSNTLEVD